MSVKLRAEAIDRFIKGCKADGIYDDLQACCVMAGWDSLAGALTPLKGIAPTNSGFIATDYDRGGIGIAGDGTSFLNSNRADTADAQDDHHIASFAASGDPSLTNYQIGVRNGTGPSKYTVAGVNFYSRSNTPDGSLEAMTRGTCALSRNEGASFYLMRGSGASEQAIANSNSSTSGDTYSVFGFNSGGTVTAKTVATISFYSIGSSLGSDPATGLALLDSRVSTLMADLRAIEEIGFDRDAVRYLRAVEEADSSFLETDVKVAVNNLVSGLKADGLWDAIGSSCLLCGPRTLAGALVPLRGDAPTSYAFASGDYNRVTGLKGDGSTTYLDAGRASNADGQNDRHHSVYVSAITTAETNYLGAIVTTPSRIRSTQIGNVAGNDFVACGDGDFYYNFADGLATGLIAASRSESTGYAARRKGASVAVSSASATPVASNVFVYSLNRDGLAASHTDARLAFYSIGASLSLESLDTQISAYVAAIAAAL